MEKRTVKLEHILHPLFQRVYADANVLFHSEVHQKVQLSILDGESPYLSDPSQNRMLLHLLEVLT